MPTKTTAGTLRRRAAVALAVCLVPLVAVAGDPASAAEPQPSICSGGSLAGRSTNDVVVSGNQSGSLWVGAGASVRVTGTVRNISSIFGADMSWRLDPFASGVTPAGQTSTVDTTWTNGSSDQVVSFSFVMNSIFTNDYAWDFTFVAAGPQPFACRANAQQLGADQSQGAAADPVNTATGNFFDTSVDLWVPSVFGLAFERTYNSLAGVGPAQAGGTLSSWLGPGWTTTLDERLTAVRGGLVHRSADGQRQFFPEASPTTWQVPPELFATAVAVADGGRELRFAWGEVRSFLPDGRIRWFDDGAGQRVTVTRATGSVVLTSVVGGVAGFEVKAFDDVVAGGGAGQDNLLDRVEIPGGPRVTYTYASGRLARVALAPPAGEAASGESFTYVNGQLDTIAADAGGGRAPVLRVDNAYDAQGRVQSQVQAGGEVATFAYAELDPGTQTRTTVVTHGAGADAEAVTYVHDRDGRLVRVVDPFGRASGRSWERDRPDTVTSRQGAATDYDYDAAGRLVSEDLPHPSTPGTAAGARRVSHCATAPTDPRVRSVTDAAGVVTEYRYGAPSDPGFPCATGQTVPSEVVEAVGTEAAATTRVESSGGLVSALTDADGVRREWAWDPVRRLVLAASTDADPAVAGKETTYFAYDAAGRRRVQRSPLGIETWWAYDGAGRLTAVVGPLAGPARTCGATTCDFPDTAPAGPTVGFEYWADGSLRARVDEAGKRWDHRIDVLAGGGWEVRATEPDGDVAVSAYDGAGRLRSVTTGDPDTPAELATVTYDHDRLGRVRRRTSAEGVQTHFGYDADGNPTTVVAGPDPADPARTTTRSFDLRGRLTSELGPTGDLDRSGNPIRSQRTWSYDDADRPVETTEGSGATLLRTWLRYDAAGRLRFVIVDRDGDAAAHDPASPDPARRDPADSVTEYRYTPAGRLAATVAPPPDATAFDWVAGDQAAKLTESYRYDGAGQRVGVTGADGESVTAYDADGRTKRVTLPGGAYRRYTRDPAGRVISLTTPSPTGTGEVMESWNYDPRGLVRAHFEPRPPGATGVVAATFGHTDDGRLAWARNPLRNALGAYAEVTYGYDGRGNRRSRTAWANPDPAAPSTYVQLTEAWEHDQDDRLVAHVRPSGARTTYGYDALGRRSSAAFASGRSESRSYRNSGALRTVTSRQPGQPDVVSTRYYDDRGRVGAVSTGDTYLQYSWDRASNLIQAAQRVDSSLQVTKYRYDLSDRHTTTIFPGGAAVGRRHDRAGRVAAIELTEAGGSPATVATYGYDANGRLDAESLGAGGAAGTRAWTYPANAGHRPVSYAETVGGTGSTVALGWAPSGRLASQASAGTTTTYAYDPAGQLTSRTTGADTESWSYDARGSVLTHTVGGLTMATAYDADARPLATRAGERTKAFSHDGDGRRIAEVITPSALGNRRELTYDARGRLVATRTQADGEDTTLTRRYDGEDTLVDTAGPAAPGRLGWDQAASLPTVAALGAGAPTVALHGPAGLVATRAPGGPVAFASRDHHGSVLGPAMASYDPWGMPEGDGSTGAFAYRSELVVDGLVHLRARDYDAVSEQFTTPDPLDGVDGTPTVANPYHYADNDPLSKADPSGMRPADAAFVGPLGGGPGIPLAVALALAEPLNEAVKKPFARPCLAGPVALATCTGVGVAVYLAAPLVLDALADARRLLAGATDLWVPTVPTPRTDPRPSTTTVVPPLRQPDECGAPQTPGSDCSLPVFMPGGDTPETTAHIVAALRSQPARLTRAAHPASTSSRAWYRGDPRCAGSPGDALSCDEYPFFTSLQGGPGASLRLVPGWEQNRQGGYLRNFYATCGIAEGEDFLVQPMPSAAAATFTC